MKRTRKKNRRILTSNKKRIVKNEIKKRKRYQIHKLDQKAKKRTRESKDKNNPFDCKLDEAPPS